MGPAATETALSLGRVGEVWNERCIGDGRAIEDMIVEWTMIIATVM